MADYFSKPTQEDVDNFLKDQKDVHGEEFDIDSLQTKTQQKTQSAFSMYREAIGAPQTLVLSTGETVIVGKPKVKSIKYLLSNIDKIQEKAASANTNPIEALEDFERIMLDCLVFDSADAVKNQTIDRQEWFDELPADDGLSISEAFTKVFDIRYLLARSAGSSAKK